MPSPHSHKCKGSGPLQEMKGESDFEGGVRQANRQDADQKRAECYEKSALDRGTIIGHQRGQVLREDHIGQRLA